jgi:DNA-binding NtrC family response regulator
MATILLVDDEQVIVDILRDWLVRHGHTIIGASHGREALDICNQQADRIQLVITGINMPGMDGIELGKQLETHHPHLKVIYMSATPRKMLKTLHEDSVFLKKPFDKEVVLSAVDAALRGTSAI